MDNKTVPKVRYDELKFAFEEFRNDNIELRKQVELWKSEYKKEVERHQGHDELAYKYKCALNEIEQLKRESKELPKKHNERGAGRKPIDEDIIKIIHELKNENKTIKQIQNILKGNGIKISSGAIHKSIQRLLV